MAKWRTVRASSACGTVMAFRSFILAVGLLLPWSAALAFEESLTVAGLRVVVWSEPHGPEHAQPVIIFSHGFHGCATQSRFLMEAFAKAGYTVFAPNHRDATCHGGEGSWLEWPSIPFRDPIRWSDSEFRDRADDIRRLLDAIRTDERFRGRVDLSRLGLAGHSLGGYTVLGLAGAWPSWRLPGAKAVLALSPYSQPFIVHRTLRGLSAPIMYQGGSRDFSITPGIEKVNGAYDQSPSPKFLVELAGGSHFAWTNLGMTARDPIVGYSVAFMNRYVKGEPGDAVLTHAASGVSAFRYSLSDGGAS